MIVDLADNLWVIFAAYVAAFLPWALISSSFDVISPVWKTVSDTWTEGVLVIFYSSIPAAYIIFYIVLQAWTEDFKEMFAAIVAFLFSLLYIFRALWGLWKLRVFRHWAAHSIVNLGKLGIVYKTKSDSETLEKALKVADGLYVNDTIIDNQLSSGSCPCYVRYGSHVFQISSNRQPGLLPRLLVLPSRLLFPVRLLIYILKDIVSGHHSFQMELIPERPVEVWLNWAVAFASQGLEEWIREFAVAQNPDQVEGKSNLSNAELFRERQRYFAGEILSSAALHFWPIDVESSTLSPMLWNIWAEGTDVYDGKVSKQELLRKVIQTGKGLPFNTPHELVKDGYERNLEASRFLRLGYVTSHDYAAFSRQLRRTVGSTPAGFGGWIEEFDKEKLEWLAIMLSLGAYASELEHENDSQKKECISEDGSEEHNDSSICEYPRSEDETVEQLDSKDLAVENLLGQLGLETDDVKSAGHTGIRSLCAFPLPDSSLNKVARCNRLAMRVGEMIDIWCALEAGRQVMFLKGFGEDWDSYCLGRGDVEEDEGIKVDEKMELQQTSQEGARRATLRERDRLLEAHKAVEAARCQFQLAEMKQRYWHMEQGITFMGYGMEFVRTELATWKKENESSEANAWKAPFGEDTGNGMFKSEVVDLGVLNEDMMIGSVRSQGIKHLMSRSIQARIIWELQQRLECACKKVRRGPGSVELMMLCVLCFPCVNVVVEEEGNSNVASVVETSSGCAITLKRCWGHGEEETENESRYEVKIKPQCAPQKVEVITNLTVKRDLRVAFSASLQGRCRERQAYFMWEWWRDSFTARLESARKWRSEHKFPTAFDVRKTEGSMADCVREGPRDNAICRKPYYTWTGWLPFRMNICRFELESPEFLWQHNEVGKREHIVAVTEAFTAGVAISKRAYCCVPYDEVRRQQLRHFNVVVREVALNGGEDCEQHEKKKEESVVARALELLKKSPEHFSRAMFLFETAITEREDLDALENYAANVTKGEAQDIGRALDIIENYVSALLPRDLRHFSYDEHNQVMSRIKRLLNELVRKDGYSERSTNALRKFVRISCAVKMENTFDALRILETLFFCTRSLTILSDYSMLTKTKENEKLERTVRTRVMSGPSANIVSLCTDAVGAALYHFVRDCFWRGVSQGQDIKCKVNLAIHLEGGAKGLGDPVQAKALYEEAIVEGDVRAKNNLALLLVQGAEGVRADAERAKKLLEEAIKEGRDVEAKYNLALLLEEGAEGVGVDAVRARELYEEAIKEGRDVEAMYNLALLLEEGAERVGVDAVRAKELYEEAIKEGRHVGAMNNLACLLENGAEGVGKDAVRAKELYEEAIKEGRDVDAMNNLAELLEQGAEGVGRDEVRATELRLKAQRESEPQ